MMAQMEPESRHTREYERRFPDSIGGFPVEPRKAPKKRLRFRRRQLNEDQRERRRLRIRRHGRRAYIRSVYSLPSLATLGNAICGFGAIYVASLESGGGDFVSQ